MTALEKINSLQYFDGLKSVKDILKNIFSSITSLETNSVIVLSNTGLVNTFQTSGSLVIGGLYNIPFLELGDNFTNVGYVSNSSLFIATGTTPTNWSNSTSVQKYTSNAIIEFNDIDNNILIKAHTTDNSSFSILLTITNGKFINNKIFTTNSAYTWINNNNIALQASSDKVKIEVYN